MGSNVNTLQHMLEHCHTIGEYLDEANIKTLKDFTASRIVQDAVVMRLLALGELTTHLSDEFKTENSGKVDWRNLKQLRNVIAHRYGSVQFDAIWDIVQVDIPVIRDFCADSLEQLLREQKENSGNDLHEV